MTLLYIDFILSVSCRLFFFFLNTFSYSLLFICSFFFFSSIFPIQEISVLEEKIAVATAALREKDFEISTMQMGGLGFGIGEEGSPENTANDAINGANSSRPAATSRSRGRCRSLPRRHTMHAQV